MSADTTMPTWFPSSVDVENASTCSHVIIEVARQLGFTRETYAVGPAQAAEALVGHAPADDLDGEVLKFVSERLRATADAIDRSAH